MELLYVAFVYWLHLSCYYWHVDPNLAFSVASIESRQPGAESPIRFDRLGHSRFYGPMGINRECFPEDSSSYKNPFWNTWYGVKALRGKNVDRVLRRYNTESTEAYLAAVRGLMKKVKHSSHSRGLRLTKTGGKNHEKVGSGVPGVDAGAAGGGAGEGSCPGG